MKMLLAIVAMTVPLGAAAQAQHGGYSNEIGGFATTLDAPRDFPTFDPNRSAPFDAAVTTRCTPSAEARQERISRAIALRSETAQLMSREGGSLSRWSKERVRRKASAILSHGC